MTTPAGHALMGLAVFLATPGGGRRRGLILLGLLLAAALAPDVDLFPLLWGDLDAANQLHQGITHSLLLAGAAAALLTLAASALGCGSPLLLLPFFLASAWSHLLLDLLTGDSREPIGIPLLWPFSGAHFSSPVSIFGGVIKGRFEHLLSWHNLTVVAGELLVLVPLVAALWLLRLRRAGD